MIEVRGLTFSYGERPVLDHLDFTVRDRRLMAVLGENGAGKSTLFKCMLGILDGWQGEILLDGRDLRTIKRRDLAGLIGYVPQNEKQIYNYSVFDVVLMGTAHTVGALSAPTEEQTEKARAVMEMLGITHLKDRGINAISGGERQLVLLARALAQDAKTLIMDEPTANLDYGHQHQVMMMIRSLTEKGYSILLSTHNPEHAVMYAQDVLAIRDHGICAFGESNEVLDDLLIRSLYGLPVSIVDNPAVQGNRVCLPGWRV